MFHISSQIDVYSHADRTSSQSPSFFDQEKEGWSTVSRQGRMKQVMHKALACCISDRNRIIILARLSGPIWSRMNVSLAQSSHLQKKTCEFGSFTIQWILGLGDHPWYETMPLFNGDGDNPFSFFIGCRYGHGRIKKRLHIGSAHSKHHKPYIFSFSLDQYYLAIENNINNHYASTWSAIQWHWWFCTRYWKNGGGRCGMVGKKKWWTLTYQWLSIDLSQKVENCW